MTISKKTYNKLFILIAVIAIIATSIYDYFEGYKDQWFFSMFLMCVNLASWITIFYVLFDNKNKENAIFNTSKLAQFFIALFFVACAITNIFITQVFATNRVKNILNTMPTKTTQASVIRIEHRGKYGASPYAIFTYTTDKGIFEQARYNRDPEYNVGDICEIIYSVEYPEMYRMGKQIKNEPD